MGRLTTEPKGDGEKCREESRLPRFEDAKLTALG